MYLRNKLSDADTVLVARRVKRGPKWTWLVVQIRKMRGEGPAQLSLRKQEWKIGCVQRCGSRKGMYGLHPNPRE